MNEDLLARVRELHEPTDRGECRHCDGEYDFRWPCATAEIVYAPEEVREIEVWVRDGERRRQRKRLAHGWSHMDEVGLFVRSIYAPVIQGSLTDTYPIFNRLRTNRDAYSETKAP